MGDRLQKDKEFLVLKKELIEFEHKFKMEELQYLRESNRLFHERELERNRIKSAEIRKAQMRKQGGDGFKY